MLFTDVLSSIAAEKKEVPYCLTKLLCAINSLFCILTYLGECEELAIF